MRSAVVPDEGFDVGAKSGWEQRFRRRRGAWRRRERDMAIE